VRGQANGNDSPYWREIAGLENVTEMTAFISRKITKMDGVMHK
jgi:hypothetical protein